MNRIILYTLTFVLMLGCISEKKARFKVDQFYKDHPNELAQTCAEKFPIHSQYIEGITIVRKDTTIEKGILLVLNNKKHYVALIAKQSISKAFGLIPS